MPQMHLRPQCSTGFDSAMDVAVVRAVRQVAGLERVGDLAQVEPGLEAVDSAGRVEDRRVQALLWEPVPTLEERVERGDGSGPCGGFVQATSAEEVGQAFEMAVSETSAVGVEDTEIAQTVLGREDLLRALRDALDRRQLKPSSEAVTQARPTPQSHRRGQERKKGRPKRSSRTFAGNLGARIEC